MTELKLTGNKQYEMFMNEAVRPFLNIIYGTFEHFSLKSISFIIGIISMLALDLFATPEAWWKALTYLVLIDWLSGMIVANYYDRFDWQLVTKKIYRATGYAMCCGSAALLANAMPEIFFFIQFIVYAAFFAKEFYSIFRIWRVWAFFVTVMKITMKGDYLRNFKDIAQAVEKEQEAFDERRNTPNSEKK